MDAVTKRWMPRFTKEHQQAQEKFEAINQEKDSAESAAWDNSMNVKLMRRDADRLEKEFNAKVQEMERTGQPDPNPDQTRELARQMDAAAAAADQAEQVQSDAEANLQKVMIRWRAAGDELQEAERNDPVWPDFQEDAAKEQTSQMDPQTGDPMAASGMAAASADTTGSDLLGTAPDQGSVGDEGEDSDLMALGQGGSSGTPDDSGLVGAPSADLDAGLGAPDSPDWPASSDDGSQLDSGGMDPSGGVDPMVDSGGGDVFADQPAESDAGFSDAPPEQEFVDEGA